MTDINFQEIVKAHEADRPITPSDECNYGDMYKRESALIELVREMKGYVESVKTLLVLQKDCGIECDKQLKDTQALLDRLRDR